MEKQFKGFKEGCRYLVKDDSKFWDTSFELMEIYILEISEKAIKIEFDNGDTKWYLKETFNFSMIENLSSSLNTLENSNDLEWQDESLVEYLDWDSSVEYAKDLGYGWRLPNKDELIEAIRKNKIKPDDVYNYWTSDVLNPDDKYAYSIGKRELVVTSKTNYHFALFVRNIKKSKQTIRNRSHDIQFEDVAVGNLRLD